VSSWWSTAPAIAAPFLAGLALAAVIRRPWSRARADVFRQLALAEHRLELALETSNEGTWDWSRRQRVHLSPRAMDVLGLTRKAGADIGLTALRRCIHPDDRRVFHLALLRHLRFNLPFDVTCRVRLADGDERWIRTRGRARRNASGRVEGVSGFVGDVTAARRAEVAEAELAARHASVLTALPDLMFELDESSRIVRYHAADESGLLMAPAAFLGKRTHEVLPEAVALQMDAACRRLQTGARVETIEYTLPGRSGETTDFEGRFVRISTGGYLCIVRNITERKLAEAELLRHRDNLAELVAEQTIDLLLAKEAAERVRRGQAQFLARLSHDLRSPLHAIMGFAEIAQANRDDASRQAQCIEKIADSARRLSALVSEVRDVSRAELDGGQLRVMPVDWEIVCRDVLAQCAPMFEAKRLEVRLEVGGTVCPVRADGLRLHQVVENLITNAVKFSPVGGVVRLLLGCQESTPEGEDEVVLTVMDDGVGLENGDDPFESLIRPASALTEEGHGGALGLAICRHYVEAFSGRIEAENRPAGGALFRVRLPCAKTQAHEHGGLENARA